MSPKLHEAYCLYEEINAEFFEGRLTPIRLLLETRAKWWLGMYTYSANQRGIIHPERTGRATIHLHAECWREPNTVLGVLVHEMIHQYQAEVLGIDAEHCPIFKSIARQAKKRYGVPVSKPHAE